MEGFLSIMLWSLPYMLVHFSFVFHTLVHLFILKMHECLPGAGIGLELEINWNFSLHSAYVVPIQETGRGSC